MSIYWRDATQSIRMLKNSNLLYTSAYLARDEIQNENCASEISFRLVSKSRSLYVVRTNQFG